MSLFLKLLHIILGILHMVGLEVIRKCSAGWGSANSLIEFLGLWGSVGAQIILVKLLTFCQRRSVLIHQFLWLGLLC